MLRKHLPSLRAIFTYFCPPVPGSRQKKARLPCTGREFGWEALLSKANFFTIRSFTIRHARLVFTWSRMRVADELLDQFKTTSLALTDFLEAITRLADMLWVPADDDLEAARGC